MKLKIISNIYSLQEVHKEGVEIELCRYPKTINSITAVLRMFWKSFGYDYIVLNFTSFDILLLAFLKLTIPFNRCRLVTVDLLLTRPCTFRERFLHPCKVLLLKRVHLFLVLMKDTSRYQKYFRLRPEQFRYLPYKINAFDLISKTAITDEGYIFCGGKSRRDFKTLFAAVRGLPYPVKLVTVSNAELAPHGSFLDAASAPSNVEIIRHDGSVDLFVKYMSAARLVVIPIKRDIITQAGIAVYIMAMALKKCVIISAGPGVDDVLPTEAAVIVPPEEISALTQAIKRVWSDEAYRQKFEKNGYDYAMTLGEEKHFIGTIVDRLCEDSGRRK